jgi:NTP pyrophosphatase (non-canonical NTP hydrolase)
MNIKKYIKEAHENAVEKGFYTCPECGGYSKGEKPDINGEMISCSTCNSTGKHKNIGELLMLIVSELSEALEADRKHHYADLSQLEKHKLKFPFKEIFENSIKNSFEDEIADVFIRLFDLCGYLEIKLKKTTGAFLEQLTNKKTIGSEFLFVIKNYIPNEVYCKSNNENTECYLSHFYSSMLHLCKKHNIDIKKHIDAKMAYNRTRPHKHGKRY